MGKQKNSQQAQPTNAVKKSDAKPSDDKRPKATKASASTFLQERLNKKVKQLRGSQVSQAVVTGATDSDAMIDSMECVLGVGSLRSVEDLAFSASSRASAFERQQDTNVPVDEFASGNFGLKGHGEAENNRSRFFSELRKVLNAADVVIEVLDARDPGSCRSKTLEREVAHAGKKLVLLLNKIDLVPKEAVEAWEKHLRRSFPVIAFKCARGAARPTHAMTKATEASEGLLRSSHGVIGADELMQLLKNYARTGLGTGIKSAISVGIVGYPNTGKSSVINSMKRMVSVQVGGTAGVTKQMQEVRLDSKVTLIDCPGVVFDGASDDPGVILRNVVTVEHVQDPVGVVDALIARTPRDSLLSFYGMDHNFGTSAEFLIHVAQSRGKLRRGSGLDLEVAARSVLADWTAGKFRYFVLPEETEQMRIVDAAKVETAEVVPTFAPALDIDSLLRGVGAKPQVLGAPLKVVKQGAPGMAFSSSDVDMSAEATRGAAKISQVGVDM